MSAEELGRRLLGQATSSSTLDQLLSALVTSNQEYTGQKPRPFNIQVLDNICRDSPLRRPHQGSLQPPLILELVSAHKAAGKTRLLYHILSLAVLPQVLQDIDLGGAAGTAVVLDADARFEVEHLAEAMRSHVKKCALKVRSVDQTELHERLDDDLAAERDGPSERDGSMTEAANVGANRGNQQTSTQPLDEEVLERLIVDALRHIHVFRPQSLAATNSTLAGLPDYLLDFTRHSSADRKLQCVILDSADAFYWTYRAEQDRRRASDLQQTRLPGSTSDQALAQYEPMATFHQLIQHLKRVSSTLKCPVVTTTTDQVPSRAIGSGRSEFSERGYQSSLPPPWSTFPTHRLHLSRDSVTRFAPTISIEQASRERAARQAVVHRGRFTARFSDGQEAFGFAVTPAGIAIEDTS